ncbi:IS3 family transposase [Proteus vulgaris]|nr:IS3 family transposase [Proteus vulgaris]MBG5971824.1 IS3 family transposase [Proteus vulgaris]
MQQIHNDMDATYGKRRMVSELQDMGFSVGLEKVRRWMKKLNLVAKRPKQHRYPSGGVASVIAPNKLNRQFNPEQLNTYWSGGGFINWSFLQAGLVDELSLVLAPLADGENSTPTLFEKSDFLLETAPVEFALKSVEAGNDSIWLRYTVKNAR